MTGMVSRLIAISGISGILGASLAISLLEDKKCQIFDRIEAQGPRRALPTRAEQLQSLQDDSFDIVIIGGGATGAGCALDATTRGLKTALIECDDFASGTSSKSTKLIHGGVRYLQKAIMKLDLEQYRMVKEALHERAGILNIAPHLAQPLPIMLPVYTWWQIPYFWIGIKMYDMVAWGKNIKSSYLLSKKSALEIFPMLRQEKLCAAIVYYDGQKNDSRLNLAIALTATRHGATIANHVSVIGLNKATNQSINGVKVKDEITGKTWLVQAKCVVNATGPFTDTIRLMDDPNTEKICSPSSGIHITLPGYYSPEQMGLLDPATRDGRVIFFLPWQKHTIAGTTDLPCQVSHNPKPTEDEIVFILEEIKNYLSSDLEVRRGDVLSAWSGIRPLVSDPNKPNTESLARNHIVHVSPSGLVTIAGGKWTTYRSMAQDTIDAAIAGSPIGLRISRLLLPWLCHVYHQYSHPLTAKSIEVIVACSLKPTLRQCQTASLLLEGAHCWSPTMYIRLVQDFGLESEVAQHLSRAYGDRAFAVAKLASPTGKRWPVVGRKIHPEFPYIEAEVRYGVREEYAMTAVDMIARRLRIAFLNVEAAEEALPGIIDIMGRELNWSEGEKGRQYRLAKEFLYTQMGQSVNRARSDKIPISLKNEEILLYIKRFQSLDKERKGFVSINDIRQTFALYEENDEDFHEILRHIDTNMNGQVDLNEYLQLMSVIKSSHVDYTKFSKKTEQLKEEKLENDMLRKNISVERSGGGL